MSNYTDLLIIGFVCLLMPAVALTWLTRPHPFFYVFRGGEAALAFAMAVDCSRRLTLIASGVPVGYPGDGWAIFNFTTIIVVALLFWGRLAQILRHRARNQDARNRLAESLKDRGVDVDRLLKEKGLG